ncbi:Subtilisin-like protease SBT3.3 [Carex littledalei]|uniref:Subtilisin-like protease SBT3.3 n=1 Tax=Carex littledalei TaxID=544730 RepID=A0A833QJV1_9POAL|nr:Subtilisin-like protease SBT3.3 [Carex littledalei]
MNFKHSSSIVLALIFCIQIFQLTVHRVDASSKIYIVYLGERKHDDPELVTASHHEKLTPLFESKEEAVSSIVYSYKHGFSGFAAMLNESQAQILSDMPDVISVTPNRKFTTQTTRSWDFLGLDNNPQSSTLLQKGNYGEDIIIGIIDSGIWPESKSFDPTGFGPAPERWTGKCQTGDSFGASNCSNKIIGARWYASDASSSDLEGEYLSPRDYNGHGTHTASTAAGKGNVVSNTSFHSLAAGSVRGGAPRARLAIYKACWGEYTWCSGAAILAAVDDAINDGVDVISMSISGGGEYPGTLHAIARGITVVLSAGNQGPAPQSVKNNVPWVISVAASTIDRSFPTVIQLGNSQRLVGQSIFYETQQSNNNNFTMLVNGWSCDNSTLTKLTVTGKIVLCYDPTAIPKTLPRYNFRDAVKNVQNAGGRGLIYAQYTPDVAAPGVSILAAVNGGYEFMSGTSMACPHVTGVVALLKSLHPDWSPSAIKSAIVTTDPKDYTKFFNCTLGPSEQCDSYKGQLYQLNLPSIAVPDLKEIVSVWRTVTNVGPTNSTYRAFVQPPAGVSVFVEPNLLSFNSNKSIERFKVTFVANRKVQGSNTFGSLTWCDGSNHSVRIPIAVRTIIQDFYADTA